MTNYKAILRSYRADAGRRAAEEAWWSDPKLGLHETIRRAAMSEIPNNGRLVRFSHQCLLTRGVIPETVSLLLSMESEIGNSTSFEELHGIVSNVCSTVHGAGDLYAYDVAQRIGLRLGHRPERIYLHRGTRTGARALGISVANRKSIGMDELPAELRELSPSEAEDVLCIYKSFFGGSQLDDTDIPETKGCKPRTKRPRRC